MNTQSLESPVTEARCRFTMMVASLPLHLPLRLGCQCRKQSFSVSVTSDPLCAENPVRGEQRTFTGADEQLCRQGRGGLFEASCSLSDDRRRSQLVSPLLEDGADGLQAVEGSKMSSAIGSSVDGILEICESRWKPGVTTFPKSSPGEAHSAFFKHFIRAKFSVARTKAHNFARKSELRARSGIQNEMANAALGVLRGFLCWKSDCRSRLALQCQLNNFTELSTEYTNVINNLLRRVKYGRSQGQYEKLVIVMT